MEGDIDDNIRIAEVERTIETHIRGTKVMTSVKDAMRFRPQVAIVTNQPPMTNWSEAIDQCDEVIRISRANWQGTGLIGKRCTQLYLQPNEPWVEMGGEEQSKPFVDAASVIYIPRYQKEAPIFNRLVNEGYLPLEKVRFIGDDYMGQGAGAREKIGNYISMIHGFTTGALALVDVCRRYGFWADIFLFGFTRGEERFTVWERNGFANRVSLMEIEETERVIDKFNVKVFKQ